MTLGRRSGGGAARRPKPCVRACAPLDAIAHAAAAAAASVRHAARGEAIKRFVAVSCSCCKKPRRPQPRCRSRRHGTAGIVAPVGLTTASTAELAARSHQAVTASEIRSMNSPIAIALMRSNVPR
ncbi:hypothetical protein NX868_24740 [Burkholderia thailandensis]|uniref:Uncharacterized protein n=1 Tax=Burkholderia thailandensis TaxID=57975 RepID=A0AAW9CNN3_BURTH|nr:hypothetical protein [Burkholderia thailandensis]MCS3394398.1 hypothetical protein [Burkholderia thailandensis]MCS6427570.1 hypothetical protein [Burkholderia thailandensis]MCS6455838.1 hypothetical protein [Burkholderia thailandensis]MCS6466735.1 hypothetical protein [Burkholderia thailandensis]MCS6485469.1 hypothetical protein [Burkholderia thailandensis]